MTRLVELASTIRSKNAGVDHITFDIVFRDRSAFERTVAAEILTPMTVSQLYGIPTERITAFVVFDPANAIKFTIRRSRSAGSPGEPDPFGSQCYPPLFEVEVP